MDTLSVAQIGNKWVFEDGTTLPVVSGGADEEYDWTQDEELSDYGKQFLEQLPEDQRPIGATWVKNWDKGYQDQMGRVTSKHQEELSRYSQLGSPESLGQHVQVSEAFQRDPYGTIKRLADANYLDKAQLRELVGAAQQMEENEGQQQPETPSWKQDKDWQIMQQGLAAVAQRFQEMDQSTQAQQQEQALNQQLEQIKQKAPGIDETYALSIAYAMMRDNKPIDVDSIANQWRNMQQNILQQHRAPNAPRTMPGAGSPNTQVKDPSKLSADERVKYLTQALMNNG